LNTMEEWKSGSSSSVPQPSYHHRKAVRRTMSTSGIDVNQVNQVKLHSAKAVGPSAAVVSTCANNSRPKGLGLRRRLSDSIPPQALDLCRTEASNWRKDLSSDWEETKEIPMISSLSSRYAESPSHRSLFGSESAGSYSSEFFSSASPALQDRHSPSAGPQESPSLFSSRSFGPFPFVKEDSISQGFGSTVVPESMYELRNPDPVFIPSERKALSIVPGSSLVPSAGAVASTPVAKPNAGAKPKFSLHFGSDKIWSHSATPSEKENSAWKSTSTKSHTAEPLRFMPLSLRSILDC